MRSGNEVYVDGVLRKRWDYATRTYTEWDAVGAVTLTRPYNAAEAAEADRIQAAAARESVAADMRARIATGIAALTADRTTAATLKQQADTLAASASATADVKSLAQGLSSMAVWRGQVDQTLFYLARLAADQMGTP